LAGEKTQLVHMTFHVIFEEPRHPLKEKEKKKEKKKEQHKST